VAYILFYSLPGKEERKLGKQDSLQIGMNSHVSSIRLRLKEESEIKKQSGFCRPAVIKGHKAINFCLVERPVGPILWLSLAEVVGLMRSI
jgi:hypothetical protein